MINRAFVVIFFFPLRKKIKEISVDFPHHMCKMHSGGPVLANFGGKTHAHCFILSFQWHEMGSKAQCMILSWEPGKHPAHQKLLQMGWERTPGQPCVPLPVVAEKCRHCLEALDTDHCSGFLLLHRMFAVLCFFTIIFDQGHVSVKSSNNTVSCSFSRLASMYTLIPLPVVMQPLDLSPTSVGQYLIIPQAYFITSLSFV